MIVALEALALSWFAAAAAKPLVLPDVLYQPPRARPIGDRALAGAVLGMSRKPGLEKWHEIPMLARLPAHIHLLVTVTSCTVPSAGLVHSPVHGTGRERHPVAAGSSRRTGFFDADLCEMLECC